MNKQTQTIYIWPGKWRGTHRETILSISENQLSIKLSLARKEDKKRIYTGSI